MKLTMNIRLTFLCIMVAITASKLHGMDQEPPRKSPKMALSFILNCPSAPVPPARYTRRLYTCLECGIITNRRLDFEKHVIEKHGGFTCHEIGCCHEKFASLREYILHLRRFYKEIPNSCPLCSKSAFIREYLSNRLCKKHTS